MFDSVLDGKNFNFEVIKKDLEKWKFYFPSMYCYGLKESESPWGFTRLFYTSNEVRFTNRKFGNLETLGEALGLLEKQMDLERKQKHEEFLDMEKYGDINGALFCFLYSIKKYKISIKLLERIMKFKTCKSILLYWLLNFDEISENLLGQLCKFVKLSVFENEKFIVHSVFVEYLEISQKYFSLLKQLKATRIFPSLIIEIMISSRNVSGISWFFSQDSKFTNVHDGDLKVSLRKLLTYVSDYSEQWLILLAWLCSSNNCLISSSNPTSFVSDPEFIHARNIFDSLSMDSKLLDSNATDFCFQLVLSWKTNSKELLYSCFSILLFKRESVYSRWLTLQIIKDLKVPENITIGSFQLTWNQFCISTLKEFIKNSPSNVEFILVSYLINDSMGDLPNYEVLYQYKNLLDFEDQMKRCCSLGTIYTGAQLDYIEFLCQSYLEKSVLDGNSFQKLWLTLYKAGNKIQKINAIVFLLCFLFQLSNNLIKYPNRMECLSLFELDLWEAHNYLNTKFAKDPSREKIIKNVEVYVLHLIPGYTNYLENQAEQVPILTFFKDTCSDLERSETIFLSLLNNPVLFFSYFASNTFRYPIYHSKMMKLLGFFLDQQRVELLRKGFLNSPNEKNLMQIYDVSLLLLEAICIQILIDVIGLEDYTDLCIEISVFITDRFHRDKRLVKLIVYEGFPVKSIPKVLEEVDFSDALSYFDEFIAIDREDQFFLVFYSYLLRNKDSDNFRSSQNKLVEKISAYIKKSFCRNDIKELETCLENISEPLKWLSDSTNLIRNDVNQLLQLFLNQLTALTEQIFNEFSCNGLLAAEILRKIEFDLEERRSRHLKLSEKIIAFKKSILSE